MKQHRYYEYTDDEDLEPVNQQIVAGLKPYYKPEDLLDKRVVVFANLKERKMGGILSQGMILCATKNVKQDNGKIKK